jgi:hypothetical protein
MDVAQIEEMVSIEDMASPEDTGPMEDTESTKNQNSKIPQTRNRPESMDLWHRQLAHVHHVALTKLLKHVSATVEEPEENVDETVTGACDVCIRAKHAQKFERKAVKRASAPFELIHSDIPY